MLDPEDINALAEALAPKIAAIMRLQEDKRQDRAYLVTLPFEEVKKVQQAKMRKARAAMKSEKVASFKTPGGRRGDSLSLKGTAACDTVEQDLDAWVESSPVRKSTSDLHS